MQQRAKVRRAPNRQVVCAGCGVPVKPTSSSTRDYCPPCRAKKRRDTLIRVRAERLNLPVLHCPECDELCAGDHGVATHRALAHGTAGLHHYRYPSTGEPA